MPNKRNYQKELDILIEANRQRGIRPRLLVHSCCAPCSSYVMEYLSQYFDLTMYFYNPNMDSLEEYQKRAEELKRLIDEMNRAAAECKRPADPSDGDAADSINCGSNGMPGHCPAGGSIIRPDETLPGIPGRTPIKVMIEDYDPGNFELMAKGHEADPERGPRCHLCYRLRLEKTAAFMAEHAAEYDYFATTLTLSPLKDAEVLNEIASQLAEQYEVQALLTDFKKKGGYQRSIELSRIYDLYRQNYCGCRYSKR